MARRESLGLRQRHVAVGIEKPDGVVEMVEIDDQLVEDALVMLDLAGDLPALLDQAGNSVGAFPSRSPGYREILMGSRSGG